MKAKLNLIFKHLLIYFMPQLQTWCRQETAADGQHLHKLDFFHKLQRGSFLVDPVVTSSY